MSPLEADLRARLEKMGQTVAALTAKADALSTENARLCQENARLEAENKLLRARIDKLVRRIFGRSSEKISPEQMELLLQLPGGENTPGNASDSPCTSDTADTWETPPAAHAAPRPTAPRRPRLPEHLPVVETVIEPDEVRAAPADWRRIGEEVSEQLDYEPARFMRRRTVRPKYVRRGDMEQPPVIAPLPPLTSGRLPRRPRTHRRRHCRQILRSPATLPSGTDLQDPPRHPPAKANPQPLGRPGRLLAAPAL